MKLDDYRICVRPGQGLVARFPTSVLVVPAPDGPALAAVDRLLEECRQIANGKPLTKRLADLLNAEAQSLPPFAVLADEAGGLAFFVHGVLQVVATGAQRVVRMTGGTTGWTGGIEDPAAYLELGPARSGNHLAAFDDRGDLRDGVVPGGAVLLIPREKPLPVHAPPPALSTDAAESHRSSPENAPVVLAFDGDASRGDAVARLRARLAAEMVPAAALDGPPTMVWGIRCKRGHFNNPDARYCRMCGTHMVHTRPDPVLGPRPVLGFLVVDDGSIFKLDADYVIGCRPEIDERVITGEARALTLSDPEDTVSPAHAAVRLEEWAVFLDDIAPHFGTHLWHPATAEWARLDPGQRVMLEPRAHILIGRRAIVFDSVNRR